MALTPMMQQYFKIKEEYPDCIIFFRLGDFYEMFFEDAEVASKELELVLTGRDCGLEERAPMCGIPYHASKNYIGRLVEKGFKVAIVEQLEDPALAKGIVKRDVIRIITPGTLNDETFLNEERNNYLMAILNSEEKNPMISLAIADITTGEFYTTTFKSDKEALKGEIAKFTPREFLLLKEDDLKDFLSSEYTQLITYNTDYLVDDESLILNHHFSVIDGEIPLNGKRVVMGLLKYLEETQKASLSNMSHLSAYNISDTMALDINSKRNLELTENIVDKSKKGSLLWILDDTMTAMGARNLRRWIEKPLINQKEITKRLESVDVLVNDLALLENLRSGLKNVYDIERITGKISQKSINAKELITLKNSLNKVPGIKELLSGINFGELGKIGEKIDPLDDIRELLESSINDNPSMSLKDGDIIKEGYNREIDELRDIKANGKVWIANLESKEREFTGINSLKIGYNKVFGYYI
ncbi:MAG: DNA mismatch repair protein MutS, partial [Clostridiaceae bacterium]